MKSKSFSTILFRFLSLILVLLISDGCSREKLQKNIKVFRPAENKQLEIGVEKINNVVPAVYTGSADSADLIVMNSEELCKKFDCLPEYALLKAEGFSIKKLPGGKTAAISKDQTGSMYCLMDIAEQLQMGKTLKTLIEKTVNPGTEFRGIKFNLPWNSYRTDRSLQVHESTIRDLNYWKGFLDMMAENRFNALTLWNLHPFSYMIRARNFPEACPYSDSELKEWQAFWHGLFRMAADRGIRTYVFNWNIMVSSAFAEKYKLAEYCLDSYPGKNFIGKGDYSPVVQKYMRESVAQLLQEYPELTGLGVSQNERMEGVEEQVWQDWIVDTYFEVIDTSVHKPELILRAHTHPAPELTRKAVEDNAAKLGKVYMDVKFNWSHAHATPDLMYIHGGSRSKSLWEPMPENYRMIYTMRNEDFFVLRWGEPDFIREVLKRNSQEYVGGYLIGSETYIPGIEYITKPGPWLTWKYAFEKQWLFYQVWGRLMYDHQTPDAVFANSFNRKYGIKTGEKLIEAHKLSDKMPLKLASFYAASWDFTLYSEGFLANAKSAMNCLYDKVSPFISVNEIIATVVLDTNLISIKDYVAGKYAGRGKTDPLQLASQLERDAKKALQIVHGIKTNDPTLTHEIDDIRTWSYLSLYFSEKLKGGTALQELRTTGNETKRTESIGYLENALEYWKKVVEITGKYMDEISLTHLNERYVESGNSRPLKKFSWANLTSEVENDIDIAKNSKPGVKN
jgi:hypothetical protein